MAKITVHMDIEVSGEVLRDILTTAVEGGSNYWLSCKRIDRDDDANVVRVVHPMDGSEGGEFDRDLFGPTFDHRAHITPDTVARGLQLLMSGALPGRSDLRANIARIPADEHDFDASDADVIVQLGYFGDVIFG